MTAPSQDRIQQLFQQYLRDPELAKEYVSKHEFTRQDVKLLKTARKRYKLFFNKEVRDEIDSLIDLIEQGVDQ